MRQPQLVARISLLFASALFCALPHNPIIAFEAKLGLSPAPWERFTGVRTLFSGMSEAFHRLATGDVMGAFSENFLAPPFALSVVVAVLLWRWPTLTRRRDELLFFAVAIIASIAVNVVHGPA